MDKKFNQQLRNSIAESIPCIHMNSMSLADRTLRTFVKYLKDSQEKGITTIDQLLLDIEVDI